MTPQQTIEQAIEALDFHASYDKCSACIVAYDNLRDLLEQMKKQEPVSGLSPDDLASLYSNGVPLYTTPQLPQKEVWQPIETAPKDGEEILICTGEGCRYVVRYDDIFSAPWRIRNDQGLNEHIPSHWMPLPAAPKPESIKC